MEEKSSADIHPHFGHYASLSTRTRIALFPFIYFIGGIVIIVIAELLRASQYPAPTRSIFLDPLTSFIILLASAPILGSLYKRYCLESDRLEGTMAALVDNLPLGLIQCRANGDIITANPYTSTLLGYSENELKEGGQGLLFDEQSPAFIAFNNTSNRFGHAQAEFQLRAKNGSRIPVEVTSAVYRGANNEQYVSMIIKDLSYIRKLEDIKSWSISALDNASSPLLIVDQRHNVVWQNQAAAAEITGRPLEKVLKRRANLWCQLKLSCSQEERIVSALKNQHSWSGLLRIPRSKAVSPTYKCSLSTVQGRDEITIVSFAPHCDTPGQQAQDDGTDALTGLLSRPAFEQGVMEVAPKYLQTSGLSPAIVVFNIDHFYRINTAFGVDGGNRVIKAFADLLRTTFRNDVLLTRLHSDRFAALFPANESKFQVSAQVDKIRSLLTLPLNTGFELASITISAGIELIHDLEGHTRDYIVKAEHAANTAQEHGGDSFSFYSEEMTESTTQLVKLSSALRAATNSDELRNAYQPIVSASDGSLVAVETLIRWLHPQDGMLRPATFLPFAEEAGLMPALTEAVIHNIGNDFSRLSSTLKSSVFSLNVSPILFKDEDFAEQLLQTLDRFYIPKQQIIVEVSEAALMMDFERGNAILKSLRQVGIHVVIDHFGRGQSSLSYLSRIEADGIKIDKTFNDGILHSKSKADIVKSIIRVTQELGIYTVAEGVETEEQAAFLRSLGYDYLQGYLFGRPTLVNDIVHELSWSKFLRS